MLQPQRRNAIRWILGFTCALVWADTCAAEGDDLALQWRRGRIQGPVYQAPAARASLGEIVVPPVVDPFPGDRTQDALAATKAARGGRVAPSPEDKNWWLRRFWLAKR